MSEAQDKKIDELERELIGVQQMLYHVLDTIGEPVVVTHDSLKEGITGDKMIDISQGDDQNWTFKLVSILDVANEQ